jgi:hypothetical protein
MGKAILQEVALLNPGQRANEAEAELDALEGARLRSRHRIVSLPARRTTIEDRQKNHASLAKTKGDR